MTQSQYSTQNLSLSIIAVGVVLTALIWGSSFLMPLAIALLVWNLLEALIQQISRITLGTVPIPRFVAMLIAVSIVFIAGMIVAQIIASQGDAVVAEAPKYWLRLEEIFTDLGKWLGPDVVATISKYASEVQLSGSVTSFLGGAQTTVANTVLILLYVGFLLIEGGYVSKKLGKLLPNQERHQHIREILGSLSENVRRYIWIKTLMSILTGLMSYTILKYLNVDFAETWALVIFLLNYIPTIGSILGVIFPAIIALIQFDTLTPFLIIALGLTAIQFTIGNVFEPMLMGNSLNLSAFVIILALTFWGTIWGPAGMVLSVPITVTVMIVAAHVPSWNWVAVLLSRDGTVYTINGK